MTRQHLLAALFGMSLSAAALAAPVTVDVQNPMFHCGNPSTSSFSADLKNTGHMGGSFTAKLVATQAGDCATVVPNKNPDGSACTPTSTNICLGFCSAYKPDKESTFPAQPQNIRGGGTAHISMSIPNVGWKKAELRVWEQSSGLSLPFVKQLTPPKTACLF